MAFGIFAVVFWQFYKKKQGGGGDMGGMGGMPGMGGMGGSGGGGMPEGFNFDDFDKVGVMYVVFLPVFCLMCLDVFIANGGKFVRVLKSSPPSTARPVT
jgi:hypothetical protein